jgi:hypothetical protein
MSHPSHPRLFDHQKSIRFSIAERSEASAVFGRSDVEIAGSNRARGMDVCLHFSVLCYPACV